ncbi:MAG TPA: hypothetical protein PLI32_10745 [Deltaproteobacteria bacterium]|nr:hypothetical protein [Deltaproteobacteria bacterium]
MNDKYKVKAKLNESKETPYAGVPLLPHHSHQCLFSYSIQTSFLQENHVNVVNLEFIRTTPRLIFEGLPSRAINKILQFNILWQYNDYSHLILNKSEVVMEILILIFILGGVMFWIYHYSQKSPEEKRDFSDSITYGTLNKQLICPHCQTKGQVRTRFHSMKQKKGISGAKATGAILTGGLSLLATGLSRKETVSYTTAHCSNCNSTWNF